MRDQSREPPQFPHEHLALDADSPELRRNGLGRVLGSSAANDWTKRKCAVQRPSFPIVPRWEVWRRLLLVLRLGAKQKRLRAPRLD
jgi:hypothetical protein